MSCGVGCRHSSDPVWLWYRLAAAAPILPLIWELPYAMGMAQKSKKKGRGDKRKEGREEGRKEEIKKNLISKEIVI